VDTILELKGVTKYYESFSVRDVSFSLPRGYIMGLVGPNGAGKTTLVKLILNLVQRDGGEIRAFGQDVCRDEIAVRSRIGFVHEAPTFYDHLQAGRVASLIAPFYATWDAGLFDRLAREFSLPLDKAVWRLSRGTRTKLALAIALAHHAELLVLDEPTTGLDPVFRRELLDHLLGCLEDGRTSVLFSTHITSDLDRIADYVAFMHNGRLVLWSPRDALQERWAVVKGGVELLNDETRRMFRGLEVGEFGFTALTDDVEAVRRRFGPSLVVIERATFEDVMLHLRGSPC
jgi:ABC-2 type transport system ATP-binding protein